MQRARTGPGRIVLAVLAGAVSAPVLVVLCLLLSGLFFGRPRASKVQFGADDLQTLLMLFGFALVIGGPVALAAIPTLFGPLWYIHSRMNRGPFSFMALAGLAGFLLDRTFWLVGGADDPFDPRISWIFPVSAALSGGVMWLAAYAGAPRITDPRTISQANFTATEPS